MLNIVFGHMFGGQFLHLHAHLLRTNLATSWLVTSSKTQSDNPELPNVLVVAGGGGRGVSSSPVAKVALANRWSQQIASAISEIEKAQPVDLYVGHVVRGSPLSLFNRANFPIVTYLEWPSYRAHGWDRQFPIPTEAQRADNNFEMMALYALLKSTRGIVPSRYAQSLFPPELREKLVVLPDVGFRRARRDGAKPVVTRRNGKFLVGFVARDLSSAKGFHRFVAIASRIASVRSDVQFVVIGSPITPYGFESAYLAARYGTIDAVTFAEHVMTAENADFSRFTFTGFLPPAVFDATVQEIDVILYPLQFGTANWGLFELLARGSIIIASNRCYLPELITHGDNGFLIDYDDTESWVALTLQLLDNHTLRSSIGERAASSARQYDLDHVAAQYLGFFHQVVGAHSH